MGKGGEGGRGREQAGEKRVSEPAAAEERLTLRWARSRLPFTLVTVSTVTWNKPLKAGLQPSGAEALGATLPVTPWAAARAAETRATKMEAFMLPARMGDDLLPVVYRFRKRLERNERENELGDEQRKKRRVAKILALLLLSERLGCKMVVGRRSERMEVEVEEAKYGRGERTCLSL